MTTRIAICNGVLRKCDFSSDGSCDTHSHFDGDPEVLNLIHQFKEWDEWTVEPILKKILGERNSKELNGRYNCPHMDFDTMCMFFADFLNEINYVEE